MALRNLLETNDCGIYCAAGDFHIDPWRPVKTALITHGHSDHARWGSKHYIATHRTVPILQHRLGPDISVRGVAFGETLFVNGVKVSFHPAGHIVGSAQIRVEHEGEVWVVTGDFKLSPDGTSEVFEPVKCHAIIMESTFGLPVFNWRPEAEIKRELNDWYHANHQAGITSVLVGYSLGKAQRLLNYLEPVGPIYTHGATENLNEVLRANGTALPDTIRVTRELPKADITGQIVVTPGSALGTPWMRKFDPYETAVASGWMMLRGAKKRKAVDKGLIISDHADWEQLNESVKLCGAERVFVTHGYTSIYSKWLREQGLDAQELQTLYTDEESADAELVKEEEGHA